ncbi:VOC family protein [Lacrimispora xylanisolvens]|uniref:VOC family protein n=1 Tax=Lacrimispora xylanisolvens TaxID=384636 RepID=UPI002402B222
MAKIFKNIDCIELYVTDINEGIQYYCDSMGLKLLWRNEDMVGLGMENDITEIVLQSQRKQVLVDIKVESVDESIEKIKEAGGTVEYGPFDVPIGRCAVILDKWGEQICDTGHDKGQICHRRRW